MEIGVMAQFGFAAFAAVLALTGCAGKKNGAGAAVAIRNADIAFAKATAERGVEGWVSYFADSGVMAIPGRNVVGRSAIRELMAPELGDTTRSLTWRPVSVEVSPGGDMGYTIGRWDRASRMDTAAPVRHGSYVTIWRKQGDGTWKAVLDIGNADPAK
jgi:ketosteroid isomerase-like protein